MATLTTDRRSGKVTGYNVQWYDGKRRFTIHLGGKRYTKKTAERFKDIVEALLFYRRNGITTPDKSVEHWLQNAPVELRTKLAKAGLLVVDEVKTCRQLWDSFLVHKKDVKDNTVQVYLSSQTHFFEAFLPAEPIEKITLDRLLEWKATLLDRYAAASVATFLKTVRTVLNWAVKQDWLPKSPMSGIPIGRFENRGKDRVISLEEYAKLLDACPNQEWRTIMALARIGGLRCPSELRQLRWKDVEWERNRFLVRSTKTEHHEGHRERFVPLFPELREELDRLFLLGETTDDEFVIQSFQGSTWRMGTQFQKIAHLAGLGTVVRPFDNLRMSRSNEVLRQFGEIKESLWIGHSSAVMKKHYFRLSDTDFSEAAMVDLGEKNTC